MMMALIAGIFLILTIRQNTFWRAEVPLFERTIQFEPKLGRAHVLLAKAYYFQGRFAQANQEFDRAFHIMQGYADKVQNPSVKRFYLGLITGIHFDWAHVYEFTGDFSSAIEHYEKALKIDPKDPVLYNNLGLVYLQQKDYAEAKEYFGKAIEADPGFVPAKNNLKQLLSGAGP